MLRAVRGVQRLRPFAQSRTNNSRKTQRRQRASTANRTPRSRGRFQFTIRLSQRRSLRVRGSLLITFPRWRTQGIQAASSLSTILPRASSGGGLGPPRRHTKVQTLRRSYRRHRPGTTNVGKGRVKGFKYHIRLHDANMHPVELFRSAQDG